MSENCPKCGQCLRIYNAPHEEWFCGSTRYPKKTGEFKQATECELRAQLAALTQRAEQADSNATRAIEHCNKVLDATYEIESKLTAAEAEVKRLREGIEAQIKNCDCYGRGYASPYAMQTVGSDLRALLAQPSDSEEP